MSGKSKMNRAKREARQEEQTQNVIEWLSITLLVCATIRIIVAISAQWMSGFKIERKFLVKKDGAPKRAAFSSSHIRQGYMPYLDATVRIRVRGDEAYLAIKGKSTHGGMTRCGFETKITSEEASHLLQLCQGGIIDKHCYLVKSGNHALEVDEFYGDNGGLVMAEVEPKSENEPYEKPDFIGPEVAGDTRFYNKYMLTNSFSAWKDTLPEEYR